MERNNLRDLRCKKINRGKLCNRLQAKVSETFKGSIEIKCPKCGSIGVNNINHFEGE